MKAETQNIVFGPVPSRRLGQSLGINNIPPKICTYSCLYCQVGRTTKLQTSRQAFWNPHELVERVSRKCAAAKGNGLTLDFLTFVSDGEPTLDANLGKEIELLRSLGIRIAVITNASLLMHPTVRADLARADWVSVKVDSVDEATWRRVNRPHGTLHLDEILAGIAAFALSFQGELVTETMLLRNINDHPEAIAAVADFLAQIGPVRSYLSIPTRPPAEREIAPPIAENLNRAYQMLSDRLANVEYLIGYEGDAFASTGNVEDDLLSITSVHPMREDAVDGFLSQAKSDWSAVRMLIDQGRMEEVEYRGKRFYVRKIPRGE
ncbi:MAG: radical SAM protein [Candidatus Eisenbacteria bacterium]|uniref:Radical SAM protein n=1 Tax=Eiseniibacteriota bacterium TaxID=2212470 RepID=A0A948RXU8_UNCEI|nr:radical SAM protein [Candidatus Eisenbacteria bacterium]MBU1950714.1 radical SAM protein [Candidatus Eisenbacteria bacterium]MBU2690229.1 radical SAM protein [Candidatus Eisenbacteria bacterium]